MVASVAMPRRRWSKRGVVSSGFVVIRHFFRFKGVGAARWSTNASACAIPTMKTSMAALGKAVRSAVNSGRHAITKGMRKTRSIGQDIKRWWKVFHMCWTSQRARPNSYRLMNSPITRSCICSVLEKQIVRRTNRLIRVRRLMCLLSIFCVFALPTWCFSASI